MSTVTRTAGVDGTFTVTFDQTPIEAPTATIYSDPARTAVAVATAALVATSNPAVWTATYPAALPAGTYYLSFSAIYTAGQPAVLDADDTLHLREADASVAEIGLLATLTQLKAQLDIKRDVHDAELELYLAAASNVVRKRVEIDLDDIPPEATLATLIIADHLWETQRSSDSRPGVDDGADGRVLLRGFAIPRRAEQLLAGLTQAQSGPLFSFPDAPAYPAS